MKVNQILQEVSSHDIGLRRVSFRKVRSSFTAHGGDRWKQGQAKPHKRDRNTLVLTLGGRALDRNTHP